MSEIRRICIVTPGPLGSGPRVVKEANALAEAGYEVTVISTRTLELVDGRDDDILKVADWGSIRIDLRSKWQRLFGRVINAAADRTFPSFSDFAISAVTPALIAATGRVNADLYIGHYPPALPAVARAASKRKVRYAFDAEDFHLGDMPDDDTRSRAKVRAIEAKYLPGAAYVTAASPGISDAYATAYQIKPTTILNVFPRANAPAAPTPRGNISPSVYWFSQTIGENRGLECAVRAAGLAQSKPHLYLRGTPSNGFLQTLSEIAGQAGCASRLHVLAPANPSEMERLASEYDIGLVGETGYTENRRIALTNKQFTYFVAGIPAIMSDIPAHREFAASAGMAAQLFRTDDAVSLADGLDRILCNPQTLADARRAAYAIGQTRYNWDSEKSRLLDLVGSIGV